MAATLFQVLTASAGSRLTDDQMDRVTAGKIVATVEATASALGREAHTSTTTHAVTSRSNVRSIRLRRIKSNLVIPVSQEDRQLEFGYASAQAEAAGGRPQVTCDADLRFSLPVAAQQTERQAILRPGRAECLCARFGFSVLPK
ncbi:MAG: hypothetical protein KDA73_15195 [Rhodobacteraceae bacterium]|nr:hypothetical protein [Paracoccaceae bacterium]